MCINSNKSQTQRKNKLNIFDRGSQIHEQFAIKTKESDIENIHL